MDIKQTAIEELSAKSSEASSRSVLVGLDGFVDIIINPVDQRFGPGDNYQPIRDMSTFGKRILAAAGKSTNIEMGKKMEKLGGNGPILANAILNAGFPTRYIGALGDPLIHPVFEDFAKRTEAVSLAEPGVTHALEFRDGKIMLGLMDSLEKVTYSSMVDKMGEGAFIDLLSRTDLFAIVNWTMLPYLTQVLQALVDQVYPNLGPRDHRSFFFDLADPEKRSDDDLTAVLRLLHRFCAFGSTTLGLNLKEAQHVSRVLGLPVGESNAEDIMGMARDIRNELSLDCVVVHPTDSAACATKDDTFYTKGFFTPDPMITTGAGDHFNAGFSVSRLLGLSPQSALIVGCAFSGYYVRSAESPSLSSIGSFLRKTEFATLED
ncbi:carbohydrate kinase family protein [Puniceicoccus vermicola]|uniref:Carbohydrate kinase family protein n=1 Tax=Puniceicoccus vermicola TaxID=388746 RepID=A0A7X1B2B8_9BACT|nr:carbohydrate kinase family protein [Puniceicoccus vermicola]MBC2604194.1 carbohydrate kinase family protein [Puniceicoccus vermicola]